MGEVDAILLAAGGSKRFGPANKLLARLPATDVEPEQSVIARLASRAVRSGAFRRVVAVLGCDATQVGQEVPCQHVTNASWASGMRSSVAVGLEATSAEGVAILLGDMPFVEEASYSRLVAAWRAHPFAVVGAPAGRPPLVLARELALKALAESQDPESGLRPAIANLPYLTLALEPAELVDIDTLGDLSFPP